jgi:hypothetical protein
MRPSAWLLVAACAGARTGTRVAVLPEVWETTRAERTPAASVRVTKTLAAHEVAAVSDEASRAALATESTTCLDDLACLRRVGERLGAGKLVTLKLAALGETLAVQLTVVDVRRAAREATMREMVSPNESTHVEATLDTLATRVAAQTGGPRPNRRSWWWLGAGGLAVGVATVAIVFVVTRGDKPDTTIVPP